MGRVYVMNDAGFPKRITIYGEAYDEVDEGLAKFKSKQP